MLLLRGKSSNPNCPVFPSRFEGREGLQGVVQRGLGAVRAGVTSGLRLTRGLADDPVMGCDHRIGNGTAAFEDADCKDGKAAVARYVPQIPGEVSLPRSAKAGNAVKRHTRQSSLVQGNVPEKFKPIKQAVHVRRVPAHRELAQPDKAGGGTTRVPGQKGIKPGATGIVSAVSNSGLDLP